MGNKKKLINKGLIDLFPKDINRFYDIFGGSGIVSMNTKANSYVLNDINKHLVSLYMMFTHYSADEIISAIESNIEKYGLARECTHRNKYFDTEKLEQYKSAYNSLRDKYNSTFNIFDFYTLMFYSFSQQFRFNSKGLFNMPCGDSYFAEKNKEYIKNGCNFFLNNKVCILNNDFIEMSDQLVGTLNEDDFVYLDPPYINTTATYTENNGWTQHHQKQLYKLCEELNNHNIKFALSNVFSNKGVQNTELQQWCNKHNWNVYTFDKFTYTACGKGNSNAKEVLIMNY